VSSSGPLTPPTDDGARTPAACNQWGYLTPPTTPIATTSPVIQYPPISAILSEDHADERLSDSDRSRATHSKRLSLLGGTQHLAPRLPPPTLDTTVSLLAFFARTPPRRRKRLTSRWCSLLVGGGIFIEHVRLPGEIETDSAGPFVSTDVSSNLLMIDHTHTPGRTRSAPRRPGGALRRVRAGSTVGT
jgi:hypothetical protein